MQIHLPDFVLFQHATGFYVDLNEPYAGAPQPRGAQHGALTLIQVRAGREVVF